MDAAGAVTPAQLSFVGAGGVATNLGTYTANKAAFDTNVRISTPITSDKNGTIYFGYQVKDSSLVGGLDSGLARIDAAGRASFVTAASLAPAGDTSVRTVSTNSAPAVSADGGTVYLAVSTNSATGGSQFGNGYLVALQAGTLAVSGRVDLRDMKTPANRAVLANDGTASPTVGPNGDVYLGVLEAPVSSSKGWMLHFDAGLTQAKPAGAFGWDNTASVVPKSMVPSYTGSSDHLIMTKYNDYAGLGGTGVNKLAILDPNATQVDPRTGATVMKEVLTIAGPTPDPEYLATHPERRPRVVHQHGGGGPGHVQRAGQQRGRQAVPLGPPHQHVQRGGDADRWGGRGVHPDAGRARTGRCSPSTTAPCSPPGWCRCRSRRRWLGLAAAAWAAGVAGRRRAGRSWRA